MNRDGITSTAIHGNKSQSTRTRALQEFKNNKVRVLVATDIAARGLDIDRLPHVVNYELPNVAEDYVHRIGRTGRAGTNGTALSLVSPEEQKLLKEIQKLLKKQIPTTSTPGFETKWEAVPAKTANQKRSSRSYNRRQNTNAKAGAGK